VARTGNPVIESDLDQITRTRKSNMNKLLALLPALLLTACMNTNPVGETMAKSNLTSGEVSMTLKKNVTTQAQVLETFGAPNIATQNGDGDDVWTYQKNATVSNSSSNSDYATIILLGASSRSSGFEQSSRTMTLIIKFKTINGVKTVADFSSRSSSF